MEINKITLNKLYYMKAKYYIWLCIIALFAGFNACKEKDRYAISGEDATPPNPPIYLTYKPLPGGVRLYYEIPDNSNLLSIEAEHTTVVGRNLTFAASYFVDSLDVFGFVNEEIYHLQLYAVNRAGVRSTPVSIDVMPLESALPKVYENIQAKGATRSFFVEWENELTQTLNVMVDFKFKMKDGQNRSLTRVFTSREPIERRFVLDLDLDENETVNISLRVEDLYGNSTEVKQFGNINLLHDVELDKSKWVLPYSGTIMGSVTMVNGSYLEGKIEQVYDGVINSGEEINYMVSNRGNPWSVLIDLGDVYELTRIITWQRRFSGALEADDDGNIPDRTFDKGILYGGSNVGVYRMHRWDEETSSWELFSEHKIPTPVGLSDIDIIRIHNDKGDEAYIHPDEPRFSKPTRWFRYEAVSGFVNNYTNTNANSLSEISLYGRKYIP